jgi:hypothetical protein
VPSRERNGGTQFLSAETFAARTARGRVGILDLKAAVGEGIDIIEFGTRDVKSAFGIDDYFDAGAFDEDVAIGGSVLQIHFVLEAAATAADYRDAQNAVGPILALQKRADLAGGVGGDFHQSLVADPEVGASRSSSLRFSHHALLLYGPVGIGQLNDSSRKQSDRRHLALKGLAPILQASAKDSRNAAC